MPKIDRKKVLRKDKIILKNQRSERIRKIIFPHDKFAYATSFVHF